MKYHIKSDFGEHAVSETIGFIIIFGLVVTGIGLVSLYGYPLLLKEQQNTNLRNMERNMIVLQNDLNSLTFKAVPYQETDLQVGGGVLSFSPIDPSQPNSPHFRIEDNDGSLLPSSPPSPPPANFHSNDLYYRSDAGAIVSLENGAVLLRYENQDGSVMLANPRWFKDNYEGIQTFVIPLVRLYNSDNTVFSQTGIGRVRLRSVGGPDLITDKAPSGGNVFVYYEDSPFGTAWGDNFFVNELGMTKISDTQYTISGINRVVIKQYNVEIIGL